MPMSVAVAGLANEILAALGYTENEIADLRAKRVV